MTPMIVTISPINIHTVNILSDQTDNIFIVEPVEIL
jgi:hypothetical protein